MKRVSKEHILLLHEIIVKYSGGSSGVRDEGMLESAINSPFATFGGTSLYPTIQSKAAKLCSGLIRNHPFIDGNKRIGILAMMSFLEANGIQVQCTDNELITLGIAIADNKITENEILLFIIEHID